MKKEYTKICVENMQDYLDNREEYDKYDIVYGTIKRNVGVGHHHIPVYKRPEELSGMQIANIIDGFFWSVDDYNYYLDCWYD